MTYDTEEFQKWMEKQTGLMNADKNTIKDSIGVLEFFEKQLIEEQPHAKVTIEALDHVIESLEAIHMLSAYKIIGGD